MAEWISVKEKLPKHRKHVLCVIESLCEYYNFEEGSEYDSIGAIMCEGYYDRQRGKWFKCTEPDIYFSCKGVTHWMPLPEPPKDGGGGK